MLCHVMLCYVRSYITFNVWICWNYYIQKYPEMGSSLIVQTPNGDLHVLLYSHCRRENGRYKAHWINLTQRCITLCFNKYINIHTLKLKKATKKTTTTTYRYHTEIYSICVLAIKKCNSIIVIAIVVVGSNKQLKNTEKKTPPRSINLF